MAQEKTATAIRPTLGLAGATMNAMALIAPGAFLRSLHKHGIGRA